MNKETGKHELESMPLSAIRAGDSYVLAIIFEKDNEEQPISGVLEFEFNDILGQTYNQKVNISFNPETRDLECENDVPKLFGASN